MLLSAALTIALLIYRLKSPIEPAYFECVSNVNTHSLCGFFADCTSMFAVYA